MSVTGCKAVQHRPGGHKGAGTPLPIAAMHQHTTTASQGLLHGIGGVLQLKSAGRGAILHGIMVVGDVSACQQVAGLIGNTQFIGTDDAAV